MTHEQLAAWRADMKLTQRAAATALGMTLATYQRLERGRDWTTGKPSAIDRRTALACAALRAKLPPEGGAKSCDSICDAIGPIDDISGSQRCHKSNARN